jgi:hypothetical protein
METCWGDPISKCPMCGKDCSREAVLYVCMSCWNDIDIQNHKLYKLFTRYHDDLNKEMALKVLIDIKHNKI